MTVADYLVAELRELTVQIGPRITLAQFCRATGVAPGTLARFCGSSTRLRIAAGLPARPWLRRLRSRRRRRQLRTACSLLL